MLRIRVYDIKSFVIGPIFRATYPFHSEYMTQQQHSFEGCESDCIFLKIGVRPLCEIIFFASEKSLALNRTRVPKDELLRSECSTTELAGPGIVYVYVIMNKLKIHPKD